MSRLKTVPIGTVDYQAGRWERETSQVITEQSVTLTVNNEPWLTFMCTPIDMEELAAGFLYNEQIVGSLKEIASIRICPAGDNIDVWLSHKVVRPESWTRTSGCSGGNTSVGQFKPQTGVTKAKNGYLMTPEKISSLIEGLSKAQDLYHETGGVHTSAMSDGERIILVAEDIGRHNTLDKLAGKLLLDKIKMRRRILLTTGRISSEMMQKAARMKIAVVISRTSPSTLSVQMAEELDITLIGYARGKRFTIYAHPERVISNVINEETQREAL
jgi:FdhD protein